MMSFCGNMARARAWESTRGGGGREHEGVVGVGVRMVSVKLLRVHLAVLNCSGLLVELTVLSPDDKRVRSHRDVIVQDDEVFSACKAVKR
jgi:hypothetical protein